MRVVLDTNVIIAAFAARGLCAEVLEVCLESHTVILSECILTEVRRNLVGKIHLPQGTVDETLAYLRDIAVLVEPAAVLPETCRDPDDLSILGTAASGEAGFIITGDEDLLTLKKFGTVGIVTPREFWEILSTG